MAADPAQGVLVAAGAGRDLGLVAQPARGGGDHGHGVGVSVRIHADEVLDLVCQHSLTSSCELGVVPVWGEETARQDCDGSRRSRATDRLLIRPAAGARPAPRNRPDSRAKDTDAGQ
jgi:hypothetical protein